MPPNASMGSNNLTWRWEENRIWSRLVSPAKFGDFVSANLQERLVAILKTPNSYGIHDDKWPIRFAVVCWQLWKRSTGKCSVWLTELWAIHDMLYHLWNLGYEKSMVESNCLHVGRMANSVADDLACLYHGAPVGTVLFQEPPLVVVAALSKDFSSLA
ncbi:hypothetical protein V6N12_055336 [Hibiscus sabdariffa]|uniref:RNase H type-1 domain-containing protein n=1 Tax=Hibiscus sabdariffa TaxID=183260 RepID=A0ABR2AQN3_9ROSI